MDSFLFKHVQLFEHEFYNINPENEDHILQANTPVSYNRIVTTSFVSILLIAVEDKISQVFFPTGNPLNVIVADRVTIDGELCAKQRSLGCRNGQSKGVVSPYRGGKFTSGGNVSIFGVQCYVGKHNDCLIFDIFQICSLTCMKRNAVRLHLQRYLRFLHKQQMLPFKFNFSVIFGFIWGNTNRCIDVATVTHIHEYEAAKKL